MAEQLHPHWRIQYIRSRKEPGSGSPFAALLAANDDEANLILHRGAHCFVILNANDISNTDVLGHSLFEANCV